MFEKIAFVKTGWSDRYKGGPVMGRHSYLAEFNDEVGKFNDGHEKFNFLKNCVDGKFYGYIPPINGGTPQPKDKDGWLVIFVAAYNGNGKLTVVGFYENASFCGFYKKRPEYDLDELFETNNDNEEFIYCITSDKATLIDSEERVITVSGTHFGSTSIVYASGNNQKNKWRDEFVDIAKGVYEEFGGVVGKLNTKFPSQQVKKQVEENSIKIAKEYLLSSGYIVVDRQKDNCGYDLLAINKSNKKEELHIEVKGTSCKYQRFLISRNEYQYMLQSKKWRLIIVSDALGDAPKIELLDKSETASKFDLEPLSWEALPKSTS